MEREPRLSPEEYRRLENIPEPSSEEHHLLPDQEEAEDYLDMLAREQLPQSFDKGQEEETINEERLRLYREMLLIKGENNYYGVKATETSDPVFIDRYYETEKSFYESLIQHAEMSGNAQLAQNFKETIEKNKSKDPKRFWQNVDSVYIQTHLGSTLQDATSFLVDRVRGAKSLKHSEDYKKRKAYISRIDGARAFAQAAIENGDTAEGRKILKTLVDAVNDEEARELLKKE